MAEVKARLKLRQGPAGTWAALNPVLLIGELGFETDTKRLRIGDGVTAFSALPAFETRLPAWGDISGRPAAFPPAAHTHLASGISDSSVIGQDLLKAPDLAAIWTLLYLGSLAGKSKISVPGDINAGGSAGSWSVLYGDGNWGPSPVAIANADPGMVRIVDAALSTTVTSAGETWVAARMIARAAGGIGTLAFAARASGGTNAFGTTIAGSSLTPVNAAGTTSGSTLTGTWRSLGWAASGGGEAGSTLWQRIA